MLKINKDIFYSKHDVVNMYLPHNFHLIYPFSHVVYITFNDISATVCNIMSFPTNNAEPKPCTTDISSLVVQTKTTTLFVKVTNGLSSAANELVNVASSKQYFLNLCNRI